MRPPRAREQRPLASGSALSRQVQVGFQRVFPPRHRLIFVNVNLKGILRGSTGSEKKDRAAAAERIA